MRPQFRLLDSMGGNPVILSPKEADMLLENPRALGCNAIILKDLVFSCHPCTGQLHTETITLCEYEENE